ncbi:MAG: 16S rRNA (guanine(966)-N(2))-methyltransferase RsmD [Pelolinea sp.]|nr:16S rRNA (guanine(966)-N(2))-methyltransferase RsmD [Pelolinea sp.]
MSRPRIIAGQAKGLRLKSVPGDITRPITDRVKEALFNIISADIVDSRFLDLFGGTGSVGIEALSRGATFVQFIDKNQAACSVLKENLEKSSFSDKANIKKIDAFTFIQSNSGTVFDYIFIAPPQYFNLWSKMVKLLDINTGFLNANTWIIVQIDPKEYEKLTLNNLEEFESRDYGSTRLIFYSQVSNT